MLPLVLLLVLLATPAALAQPIPPDMKIESPGPDVKPSYAVFSGKWVGTWDNKLDHIMIVEKVEGDKAWIIYSWGTAPTWNIRTPEFIRIVGTFTAENMLRADVGGGRVATYELSKDQKSLAGRYTIRAETYPGTFKKQE